MLKIKGMPSKDLKKYAIAFVLLAAIAFSLLLLPTPRLPEKQNECDSMLSLIEKKTAELNYCKKDSDCKAVYSICPFGCYLFVNASTSEQEIEGLLSKMSEYVEKCTKKCYYECADIKELNIKCIDARCKADMMR